MSAGSHPAVQTSLAQHRVGRLAAQVATHRAFHWLHLHQPQLRAWQLELLAIPAPSFDEQARARWFVDRFLALGLANVHLDEAGNAIAELPAANGNLPAANGDLPAAPCLLLSAHLDTVFPATVDTRPREDGVRILGPGACDNGAGLAALLGLAACLRYAGVQPPVRVLFVANVGEEGEGDLRGMRHLFLAGSYRGHIRAALALEGGGTAAVVTRALGSRRFRVTVQGPGGHSWADAGVPNPILLLARLLMRMEALLELETLREREDAGPAADAPRTTLGPGQIGGGTSVNSIPASASVLLDLRSTDPARLEHLTAALERLAREVVAESNSGGREQVTLAFERIGDRPAADLPADAPLLHTLRAVDRHLGLRTELRLGSTDANLPLSLSIPAVAMAAGGSGGGIHTLSEWYDPTGREIALRRILLTLLDLAGTIAAGRECSS